MAKTVWTHRVDLEAFNDGFTAALQGGPRVAIQLYQTYNERAAFNDGWDSYGGINARPGMPKRRNR